jgi:hypothetical protein
MGVSGQQLCEWLCEQRKMRDDVVLGPQWVYGPKLVGLLCWHVGVSAFGQPAADNSQEIRERWELFRV